ncbi:hypothetical protein DFJ69_1012 [Thermomonospora umbrina]|uniref:Uncharacterized protein n=1 Tax=Thermomonospora umbrina TaxID=111806 RepID=A0A3D9SNS6_9ACTN|nr:hypothetical protein DFJ69_1012 [Thermomonospora umbrina]
MDRHRPNQPTTWAIACASGVSPKTVGSVRQRVSRWAGMSFRATWPVAGKSAAAGSGTPGPLVTRSEKP